jgi:hypothetical protein
MSATAKPIPFPSPAQAPAIPERITQQEIVLLLSARNRLRQLSEQIEATEQAIKTRLEAGAAVESGEHVARLEEHFRASIAWKEKAIDLAERLGLNGQAWAQNVLTHTAKTRTVSLFVA